MAPWNSARARGVAIRVATLKPPADSPKMVTWSGRPPNASIWRLTHSRAATVLSLCHEGDTLSLEGFERNKALEGVKSHETAVRLAVFDNTQDIEALALDVRARLAADAGLHGYLIRGHGLYTWASSMTACRRHVEALDFLMGCELELRRQR